MHSLSRVLSLCPFRTVFVSFVIAALSPARGSDALHSVHHLGLSVSAVRHSLGRVLSLCLFRIVCLIYPECFQVVDWWYCNSRGTCVKFCIAISPRRFLSRCWCMHSHVWHCRSICRYYCMVKQLVIKISHEKGISELKWWTKQFICYWCKFSGSSLDTPSHGCRCIFASICEVLAINTPKNKISF